MCGRYTITVTIEELIVRFSIDAPTAPYHTPKYNVAPGQIVLAVINDGEQNRLGELKWGLIPSWAKDEKIGNTMINARAESLLEKPAFKTPFMRKRCLILADGFYEWQKRGESKQPMRIMLKDQKPFAMAGLYDTWMRADGSKISSCTIITTKPNALMSTIHDRMPVILPQKDEQIWINRQVQDLNLLQSLLQPFPTEEMIAYPVSKMVGNVRNDLPECIAEITT